MKKHLKPDSYYVDNYDRSTIKELKELEKKLKMSIDNVITFTIKSFDNPVAIITLKDRAINRSRLREQVIASWKNSDTRMDMLIENTKQPENITCPECFREMYLDGHIFDRDDAEILFVFKCPYNHIPNKVVYPNRREFFFPKRKCNDCGYELKSETFQKKNNLIFQDTCQGCGKTTVDELNLSFKQDEPINEAERTKYCNANYGKHTFDEELQQICDFAKYLKEKEGIEVKKKNMGLIELKNSQYPSWRHSW